LSGTSRSCREKRLEYYAITDRRESSPGWITQLEISTAAASPCDNIDDHRRELIHTARACGFLERG
jgi:hypothetical protein